MRNNDDFSLLVSSFILPVSNLIDDESVNAIRRYRAELQASTEQSSRLPYTLDFRAASHAELKIARRHFIENTLSSRKYKSMKDRYKTNMVVKPMAGVVTEVFTPDQGVSEANRNKVLINLHGGGFTGGERSGTHLESMPIASVGKIKVISVDYRMAPEHKFPAASDDVLAVYKDLLNNYRPEDIGIYGSSAGAVLTAQSIARFQQEGLPLPGAISMLAAGAYYWMEGDSGKIHCAIKGLSPEEYGYDNDLYFDGVSLDDPMAFPGRHPEILSKFPPSLLISSTRDFALSSVVTTHTKLSKHGVEADLHIWEGLDHVFYFDPEFPESSEVYGVVADFFEKHLSR